MKRSIENVLQRCSWLLQFHLAVFTVLPLGFRGFTSRFYLAVFAVLPRGFRGFPALGVSCTSNALFGVLVQPSVRPMGAAGSRSDHQRRREEAPTTAPPGTSPGATTTATPPAHPISATMASSGPGQQMPGSPKNTMTLCMTTT